MCVCVHACVHVYVCVCEGCVCVCEGCVCVGVGVWKRLVVYKKIESHSLRKSQTGSTPSLKGFPVLLEVK